MIIDVPEYAKPEDAYKDLIAIRVMQAGQQEWPIATVGHNGTFYDVPRGVDVRVPRCVAAILAGSKVDNWAIHHKTGGLAYIGETPTYPLMVLNDSDQAVTIKPRKPLAASERNMLERQQMAERARARVGSASRADNRAPAPEADDSADVAGVEIEV